MSISRHQPSKITGGKVVATTLLVSAFLVSAFHFSNSATFASSESSDTTTTSMTSTISKGQTSSTAGATSNTTHKTTNTTTSTTLNATGSHRHIALALGGGGTRGAAEIGVLRVLERNNIPIDMIAGTSMGALIGGLYIGGVSTDNLESKFANRSLMKSYNSIPPYVRIFALPYRTVKRTLGLKSFDGLYKGNVFRKFIHREWSVSDKNIEDLNRPVAALAFNLLDGNTYAIRRGNLGTALEASCAIPVLRKPIAIGNKLFVDGGSVENVPVGTARTLGGDIVIAVNVDESVNQLPPEYFYRVGSVAPRMFNLELAIADARHCKGADIVIHPNVDGIGITSTRNSDALKAIKAGEIAAQEALPAILEKLQAAGIVIEPVAKTQQ
jgi:NTE family protein